MMIDLRMKQPCLLKGGTRVFFRQPLFPKGAGDLGRAVSLERKIALGADSCQQPGLNSSEISLVGDCAIPPSPP